MPDHKLTITFATGSNVDAVNVEDSALTAVGWDGTEDRAKFARRIIREWAKNAVNQRLRGDTVPEAERIVAEGMTDVD